jgi:hypothetical protein
LGNADLIPWTLIAVNVLALIAGTWCTEKILTHFGASRWYALVYGLNAGTLMAVRLDLTEPLAYGLAQAGTLLILNNRVRWAASTFALAALTKETTLLFVAALVSAYAIRREWRALMELSVISVTPFVIWQLVLLDRFGQFGVGSGGALATAFEFVPLRGLWSIGLMDGRVFILFAAIMLPLAVIPTLIGLWRVWQNVRRRHWDIPVALLFFNAVIVLFTPQSTFREPLAMARYIVGLIAAVLLYAAARRSRRGLNYALLWIFTLALGLNESQLPI